ncbi:voltage-dependent calcium channel type A subunit alpha-1 [Sarcoptes scabiei]|nr:voltage-dependent calcium channel type A subunit alpha-1 [Sarcoptes scabiei]
MDKMKYCVANEKISSIGNIFDDSIQNDGVFITTNTDGGDDVGSDDRLNHQPSSSSQPIIIRCESNDRQTETNSFQKIDSPFAYASASCLIENSKGLLRDLKLSSKAHIRSLVFRSGSSKLEIRNHLEDSLSIRNEIKKFRRYFYSKSNNLYPF